MKRREVRQQAMQLLYQLDLRGQEPFEDVVSAAEPDADRPSAEVQALAKGAWNGRAQADELATELAEDWPTHRQPPVDRSIIRLAYHEMIGGLPPAVAINEAVELAKVFGGEQSPSFINGVLDKVARRLRNEPSEG